MPESPWGGDAVGCSRGQGAARTGLRLKANVTPSSLKCCSTHSERLHREQPGIAAQRPRTPGVFLFPLTTAITTCDPREKERISGEPDIVCTDLAGCSAFAEREEITGWKSDGQAAVGTASTTGPRFTPARAASALRSQAGTKAASPRHPRTRAALSATVQRCP